MTQTDVRRRTGEVKSDICYWQKINYGWHKLKTRIIRNGMFTMVKHEFWKPERVMRLVRSYPEEALWEPMFRVWHLGWRKMQRIKD